MILNEYSFALYLMDANKQLLANSSAISTLEGYSFVKHVFQVGMPLLKCIPVQITEYTTNNEFVMNSGRLLNIKGF